MMKLAPYHIAYGAAGVLLVAAVLTLIAGGAAMWQPITLIATSVLFAGLAIYSQRRGKRGAR